MKDWRERYRERIMTADEAVKYIKTGDRVVFGHACGEAQEITEALLRNKEQYNKIEIVHLVPMGKGEYAQEENQKYFYHNSFFGGGSTREALNGSYGDFTPSFFFEIPRLLQRDGKLPVDVAIIQVSLPDKHGYCSYGISCDYTKGAAENAKIVIAQINQYMPRTLGDSFIHLSNMNYIVEHNEVLLQLTPPKIGEIERKIGEHCAELIQDGDTLQLGIGAIPDAVLSFLKNKKHLGIHSEMISDGVVDLILAGVIDNLKKTIHKNKCIVSFLMGSQKLYDYVDNNPSVELHPVNYVNHPFVIAQNDNMVSINSALQVDLMGQVNAESIGEKQFSGTGGQVDFVRGASMSKGGKSVIAMPSTASKGSISKIVMNLDIGSAVTTSRNDVDYVVTEYGIAELKGKTLKARARALIAIAHPNFREELKKQVLEKFQCFD